jgi:hypothetical protein
VVPAILRSSQISPAIEKLPMPRWFPNTMLIPVLLLINSAPAAAAEKLMTWDGKHSIESIEVTMVYFVPRDRTALPDWKDRVEYFARRIEQFHAREYQGQSTLKTVIHEEPFRSVKSTDQLRAGDVNAICFTTLREVDAALQDRPRNEAAFPILLVLSDINWRPLEDFYRVHPARDKLVFEGQFIDGRHFPGATSGGSRATYLADRGTGWGLVSADGWRVPYCGTDCVIYHEGVGHTVGLPHPETGNGSVMSLAQYRGWISESWIDDDQKKKLGWVANQPVERTDLFSKFRVLPEPAVPKPKQEIALQFDWSPMSRTKSIRVRWQTELFGPWFEMPVAPAPDGEPPTKIVMGSFDRPTPVSYRVDVELTDGQKAELWGYFQVRAQRGQIVLPPPSFASSFASADLLLNERPAFGGSSERAKAIDLLEMVEPDRDAVAGEWSVADRRLESPKVFGGRLELPYEASDEYELTVIAEPLDEPNGLILGQRSGGNRFLVLLNFNQREGEPANALENVDGMNVNRNPTTVRGKLFEQDQLFQVVCTVRKNSVVVVCDGHELIRWTGDASRLSLSDYWKTPHDNALFIGAYNCRYRFHRISLVPITGSGKALRP